MRLASAVIAGGLCLVATTPVKAQAGGGAAEAVVSCRAADTGGSRPAGAVRNSGVSAAGLVPHQASQSRSAPGRDSLLNGALIGAAIGAGLAIADYAVDPSEPSNGAITVVAVGLGALIGAGIDALIHKDRAVTIAPVLTKRRGAVHVAVRF